MIVNKIKGKVVSGPYVYEKALKYAFTVVSLYSNAIFPEGTELIIDIPRCSDLTKMCYATMNLKRVKVSGNQDGNLVNLTQAFQNNRELEEVDFTEFCLKIGTFNASAFGSCVSLKRIFGEFDFSSSADGSMLIFAINNLEEIRFKKETVYKNVTMTLCGKLSTESRHSIVEGLATVETAQTLKLHPNVVAALTDEEKTMILTKNWSVM